MVFRLPALPPTALALLSVRWCRPGWWPLKPFSQPKSHRGRGPLLHLLFLPQSHPSAPLVGSHALPDPPPLSRNICCAHGPSAYTEHVGRAGAHMVLQGGAVVKKGTVSRCWAAKPQLTTLGLHSVVEVRTLVRGETEGPAPGYPLFIVLRECVIDTQLEGGCPRV